MPLIRAAAVAAVLALTAAAAGPAVLASWPALVLIAYAIAVLGVATVRIRGRLAGYIPGPDPEHPLGVIGHSGGMPPAGGGHTGIASSGGLLLW